MRRAEWNAHRLNTHKEISKKIADWLLSDHTGASSEALAAAWLGSEERNTAWPRDPSDFKRCYDFLMECIPVHEHHYLVQHLGKLSGPWSIIAAEWFNLLGYYHQEIKGEKAPKLYKYMQKIGL